MAFYLGERALAKQSYLSDISSSTLVKEDCPEPYTKFMVENNIRHYRVHVPANKGGICITTEAMAHALTVVLDRRNFPLLIHCNKGKVSAHPFPGLSFLEKTLE